jgi:hypothetical protein
MGSTEVKRKYPRKPTPIEGQHQKQPMFTRVSFTNLSEIIQNYKMRMGLGAI